MPKKKKFTFVKKLFSNIDKENLANIQYKIIVVYNKKTK